MKKIKKFIKFTAIFFGVFFAAIIIFGSIKMNDESYIVDKYFEQLIYIEDLKTGLPREYIDTNSGKKFIVNYESLTEDLIISNDGSVSVLPKNLESEYLCNITLYNENGENVVSRNAFVKLHPAKEYIEDSFNNDWRFRTDGDVRYYYTNTEYFQDNKMKVTTKYEAIFSFDTNMLTLTLKINKDDIALGGSITNEEHILTYDALTKVISNGEDSIYSNKKLNHDEAYFEGANYVIKLLNDIDQYYVEINQPKYLSGKIGASIYTYYDDTYLDYKPLNYNSDDSYMAATLNIKTNKIITDGNCIQTWYRGQKVQAIHSNAFYDKYSGISNIDCDTFTVPESIVYIGKEAFKNAKIRVLRLPSSLLYIGKEAFSNSTIEEIIFYGDNNNTNLEIDDEAFFDCGYLTKIELPKGVKLIGENVFYGCEKMKSIVIPETVNKLSASAFNKCSNLTNIYFCGTKQEWENINLGFAIFSSITYYYSETEPVEKGFFWHYSTDGITPVIWE